LSYWLVLLSASCFANMLGLNISSGLNSVITIYIMIPFLIIPQMLLGGVIIKFDKLHKSLSSHEYVPVIGDLMASRWAYEALAVEQFKNNRFEKTFFMFDQEIRNSDYNTTFLIPALLIKLTSTEINFNAAGNQEKSLQNIDLLNDHIRKLSGLTPSLSDNMPDKLDISTFSESSVREARGYLQSITSFYQKRKNELMSKKDGEITRLIKQMGGRDAFLQFRDDHYNTGLADLVENKKEINKTVEYNNRIIRKYEPIFMVPTSRTGRAHFYSPVKIIGNRTVDTLWFNIMAIWMMTIILYLSLYFNLLRKSIDFMDGFRFLKRNTN